MSLTMYEVDFKQSENLQFLREILKVNLLSDDAANVTSKVIRDQGIHSLDSNERITFEYIVYGPYTVETCSRCRRRLERNEMVEASRRFGLCEHCWNKENTDS